MRCPPLGDESVDCRQCAGYDHSRLHGAGPRSYQAQQWDARQEEADRESPSQKGPLHPPAVWHPAPEGIELILDAVTGQRNVSLDFSWAASHR
jgi:hypothetical protein